ncbi:MAG: ABC transporter substrate-binding protein [Trueperaceae bacterium]|nr:ABC transporter substrate-binding protein [Trueperaceae bacterium]
MISVVRSLIALVAAVLVTSAAAQIELDYWHGFTGPDLPLMEALIAEFNAANPDVVVRGEPIPWGNIWQQLEPSVAAGRAPDVVAVNEDVVTGFILRGALAEMTPEALAAAGIDAGRFYEPLWETGMVDGAAYAVPVHSVMLVMYYNKDLFEAAGLDPESPPSTREEYLAAARALTRDTAGRAPGESGFDANNLASWAAGIPSPWMGGTIAYAVAAQNGVTFVEGADADFEPNFDSPEAVEAIEFLVSLVREHGVSPANATEGSEIDAFRQGQAAMNFNGVWMLGQYADQAGLNFGVAPFPQLGTERYATWGGSSHLAMPRQRNADPAKQEAAMRFIGWMTQAEQNLFWTAAGGLPTQSAVADAEGYASNPMTAVAEALDGTFVLTGFPFLAQFRGAWDAAFEAALLGDKSVERALSDGASEARSSIQDGLLSLP